MPDQYNWNHEQYKIAKEEYKRIEEIHTSKVISEVASHLEKAKDLLDKNASQINHSSKISEELNMFISVIRIQKIEQLIP